ncbi:hypothetical protein D3C86_1557460 [compost metagenome]
MIQARHHGVVIQHVVEQRLGFRSDLDFQLLIHPAIDCVQQRFGEVGARTEELHLLADHHRADAAGDGVIIAVEIGTHQIVILVLQRGSGDRHLRCIFFESNRQLLGPQDRQVRLRRRPHRVERVQIAERRFADQRTAIQSHPADHFRGPNRIA